MTNTIYGRLGYNFESDKIKDFSANVINSLAKQPPILKDWEQIAIANDNLANLTINPVANSTGLVNSNIAVIKTVTYNVFDDITHTTHPLQIIYDTANNIYNGLIEFKNHTDRMSGVAPAGNTENLKPHLDTAIGIGKALVNFVYQSDGIVNNSPILGSFTSLLIDTELKANSIIINTDASLISSSISNVAIDPGDGSAIYNITVTNLTMSQITTISDHLNVVNTLINTRRLHDESFYANSVNVMVDYSNLKKYTNGGETMKYLITDIGIGSEQLKNYLIQDAAESTIGTPIINPRATIPRILSVRLYKDPNDTRHSVEIRYEGFTNYDGISFKGIWNENVAFASYGVGSVMFDIPLASSYGVVTQKFLLDDPDYTIQPMICYGTYFNDEWVDFPLLSEQITNDETPWAGMGGGGTEETTGAPIPNPYATVPRILSLKAYRPTGKQKPVAEIRFEGVPTLTSPITLFMLRNENPGVYFGSFVIAYPTYIKSNWGIYTYDFLENVPDGTIINMWMQSSDGKFYLPATPPSITTVVTSNKTAW